MTVDSYLGRSIRSFCLKCGYGEEWIGTVTSEEVLRKVNEEDNTELGLAKEALVDWSLDHVKTIKDQMTGKPTSGMRIKQEAQLMLTTGATRLAVSRGQQTQYHSI